MENVLSFQRHLNVSAADLSRSSVFFPAKRLSLRDAKQGKIIQFRPFRGCPLKRKRRCETLQFSIFPYNLTHFLKAVAMRSCSCDDTRSCEMSDRDSFSPHIVTYKNERH